MTEEPIDYQYSIKKRYINLGRSGIADFELLTILLDYSLPQAKSRNLAKDLFNSYGSLRKILNQPIDEISTILGEDSALLIRLLKDCMCSYFEPEIGEKVVLSSPEAVSDYLLKYLEIDLADCHREVFMVLCLNTANELLHKEILFQGTIDQLECHPKEIIRLALIKNASAIICCHNHPSSLSPIPSQEDYILTNKLQEICKPLGLRLHDHLVVGEGVYSIKCNRIVSRANYK